METEIIQPLSDHIRSVVLVSYMIKLFNKREQVDIDNSRSMLLVIGICVMRVFKVKAG